MSKRRTNMSPMHVTLKAGVKLLLSLVERNLIIEPLCTEHQYQVIIHKQTDVLGMRYKI